MCLAVGANQRACWREYQGRVVVFVCRGLEFGDTSANQIRLGFCGDGGEGVEGGRLVFGRRRWEKGLGVFGEVLSAIRRVKAFRKDY